ncbi:hypothetical protein [Wukongibacter sp. M2B1]|uniref:hypothetical protein n=1 Tax=Wukongibacter sp. M2B1 TaxID=3088895 RepID=UPI003D79A75B
MDINILAEHVEIHETPLEKVTMKDSSINIEFDDVNENRWEIEFSPFQGLNITTIDCIDTSKFLKKYGRVPHLFEVIDSKWIEKLKKRLIKRGRETDFVDKAHHYILAFQDNIVEVIAWDNFRFKKL